MTPTPATPVRRDAATRLGHPPEAPTWLKRYRHWPHCHAPDDTPVAVLRLRRRYLGPDCLPHRRHIRH